MSPRRQTARLAAALLLPVAAFGWNPVASAQSAGAPAANAPASRPGANAQQNPLRRLVREYTELVESLDLSEEQRSAVREVLRESMTGLRDTAAGLQDLPQAERRTKIEGAFREMSQRIMEKLEPAQQEKFLEGAKAIQGRLRGQRGDAPPTNTPPATGPGARVFQAIRSAVDGLELTENQKTKINDAMTEARNRIAAIEPGDPTMRDQAQQIFQRLREDVAAQLDETQRRELMEKVQAAMNNGGAGGAGGNRPQRRGNPAGNPPATPPAPPSTPTPPPPQAEPAPTSPGGESAMPEATMGSATEKSTPDAPAKLSNPRAEQARKASYAARPAAPKEASAPASPPAASAGIVAAAQVGSPAPELSVKRLDGPTPIKLANFRSRPLVLVFGSYTAPTFRAKAAQLNELAKDYRGRADVFVVYTAEAYPVGEWEIERNKDEKVRVEPHKTEADRVTAAREAKSTLKLDVPILVDDLANTTADAYGLKPNGAVVIARDGTIAARQGWFDAFGLRRAIDETTVRPSAPVTGSPSATSRAAD